MSLVVTTSWDDGYPADMRVAEVLSKHGARGTFYVPNRNSEGRPVMSEGDLKTLAASFEIGGHGLDHVVLTRLPLGEARRQIEGNKAWIEDLTGRAAPCFCYIRGRYNAAIKGLVRDAGYRYARTVASFAARVGDGALEVPTTLQLFPHAKLTYAKMLRRSGVSFASMRLFGAALAESDLERRIERIADLSEGLGGYFHLWGHSWELQELDLLGVLDRALGRLAARSVRFATNAEAFDSSVRKG